MLSSIELLAWIALVEEDYRSVGVSNEALLTTRFFPGARTRSKLDQNWIKMVIIIHLRWEWKGCFQQLQGHMEH
jgi:hypothetical protein